MVALSCLAAVLAAGLSVSPFSSFHLVKVKEVYPGSAAAPNAQYVVLQLPAPGENFVGGTEVRIHDAAGTVIGTFAFPSSVPNGANQANILIATPEALAFFSAGPPFTADLAMTPSLPALGGKVCFHHPNGLGDIDCVSYGGYEGSNTGVGTPENAPVGLMRGTALRRRMDVCGSPVVLDLCDDTDDSANDFTSNTPPGPMNNAGMSGIIPPFTCGNGALQSIEQCDDGNLANGDGCQSTCRLQSALAGNAAPFTPQALVVDPTATGTADGNRVLEPGEQVAFQPGWRNETAVPLALTSGVSRFTGPAGATYTLPDAVAGYGTIAPAATGSCATSGDCLAMGVSVPNPRPSLHWDAEVSEVNSQYDFNDWSLHVGQSFTDVPKTNPFYRFIEILLHRGVTGGCAATTYCPTGSTTREAMAVFVLLAKDGGTNPPACGVPMFADVPASSPFCRWIEELARRGVAGGCGGGNYCPQNPVTRDQMAVFVLRTLDPALNPPACGVPMFNDVPAASPFCRWVEELARRAVVSGCGGGNYCPASPVTREQMGVFLTVTFALALYGV